MPPPNSSPSHEPSSNSTTPPSEATLADDPLIPEVASSRPSWNNPLSHQGGDTGSSQHSHNVNPQQLKEQILATINTDYESSAAEETETYTTNKYENAEFALLSYSRTNKYEKLQKLLEAKLSNDVALSLNFRGQQKQNFSWSALHLACYFGHIQVVELLLSSKQFRDEIDINLQNNSGDTPLHKAALTNRIRIVQILLENGADVFVKNSEGMFAKQLTSEEHVRDMLEAAEQVDRNRVKRGLFEAVDCGDLKKLQAFFDGHVTSSEELEEKQEVKDEPENSGTSNRNSNEGQIMELGSSQDEYFDKIVDERGNTLLHLAAMRGFKAICVYLLERGFDPYRRNNAGQTCIDLSSYQLRQLFTTVKPTDSQLRKFSRQRLIRFEGPLLRKVRILGWRQIYVVLENGVILLFNNRRDSMNKSRRGYKYLESATCLAEPNDLGMFTVCFSDRSRATFLVSAEHLNSYPTFRSQYAPSATNSSSRVELIRQKWIDSIRDHIRYSTNFIKNGLNLNEDDDDNDIHTNKGDLASLNHLLPIDTIKSFIHEARAHYSILERHADSLCSLVQSIPSSSGSLTNSLELPREEQPHVTQEPRQSGSRLSSFMRSNRITKSNTSGNPDGSSTSADANRKRDQSHISGFVQDNWHCILFHLRLLMESTENTKSSMSQALALMEHQEQLRQNRIQDQDERCRILEDSLHALARDHHELEKSLSMSQIYHSAAGRSVSMSTDLNEYFDAFEDFDDEKTVTPDSMPSDEELHKKIQDIMDDRDQASMQNENFASLRSDGDNEAGSSNVLREDDTDVEEEEDDLRSNCSVLTVETVSERIPQGGSRQRQAPELVTQARVSPQGANTRRTRLPSPMVPRDQVSIWSILKNCIGKELSKITMPVVLNEPLTMLQRGCESIQYSKYLKMADMSDDPVERMEYVCAFIVAGLSCNCKRIIKPFNPLLYETYEYQHELEDGTHVKAVSQQVSHHPPITAVYCESDNFIYNGSVNPKLKFWGRSIEVQPDGQCRIYLKRHNESYVFRTVACSIHNIIVGKLWFEHTGPLDIRCFESKIEANLVFKPAGWFNSDVHRFEGFIVSGEGRKSANNKKLRFVYGKWSHYIKSVDYNDYENYMKDTQQKIFRVPDEPNMDSTNGLNSKLDGLNLDDSLDKDSIANGPSAEGSASSSSKNSSKSKSKGGDNRGYTKSESNQSLDIPNSRTLWRLESQYLEDYYNFTLFTMKLNELLPHMTKELPSTDSRFRPDVRKLEEGDLDGAANEKQRLEEKQRAARAKDKRFKEPSPDLLWFEFTSVPYSKEKFWIYKGGYWESKCNPEKFPDLF